MQDLIKTHDSERFGLYARAIYGLNIFSANGYKVPSLNDPRIVFLRALSLRQSSSIHIGGIGLSDIVDKPEELFRHPSDENLYIRAKIGVSEGTFYEGGDNSCFFPTASEAFWASKDFEGNRDPMQYLIECGAIALYANARDNIQAMKSLVSSSFLALRPPLNPSQSEWIQTVASNYQLVVVTGHDGLDFLAYTSEADNFDMLSSPLQFAINTVKASEWYIQHKEVLQWDSQYENCLMLPEALAAILNH